MRGMIEGENIQAHVIFKGYVQGIGFRATVRYLAQSLELRGKVRNREDGSVELYVQGSKVLIDRLLSDIQQEFGSNYIKSVETEYETLAQTMDGFHIVR